MESALWRGALAIEHGARAGESRSLRQKKSFSASEQDRPDVEARRQTFWGEAAQIARGRLIFLDESGCNTAMTPRYARSLVGERAQASRPVNRGKNISIVGAVRLSGVVSVRAFEGSINVAKFLDFLKHDLLPFTRAGDVLVMDNLSVHKDPLVLERITNAAVRVLFLPPYSPEFNPIELYWSSFKSALRRVEARTRGDLLGAIQAVTNKLHLNFSLLFRHCGYA
jgi:transposase